MKKSTITLLLILFASACELTQSRTESFPEATDAGSREAAKANEIIAEEFTPPFAITVTSEQDEVLQIMRYSRVMNSYPKARLKQEFKRVATRLKDDASPAHQVRMAILLSIPDTTFKNHNRAILLLTRIVNDINFPSQALQEYAYILLETYQDRGVALQLRSELADELHRERRKRVLLQQQLNALKSIEKSIIKRQQQEEVKGQ